jgi:hypothetical protein
MVVASSSRPRSISNGLITIGSLSDLAPHTKVSSLALISTVHVGGDLQDLAICKIWRRQRGSSS